MVSNKRIGVRIGRIPMRRLRLESERALRNHFAGRVQSADAVLPDAELLAQSGTGSGIGR